MVPTLQPPISDRHRLARSNCHQFKHWHTGPCYVTNRISPVTCRVTFSSPDMWPRFLWKIRWNERKISQRHLNPGIVVNCQRLRMICENERALISAVKMPINSERGVALMGPMLTKYIFEIWDTRTHSFPSGFFCAPEILLNQIYRQILEQKYCKVDFFLLETLFSLGKIAEELFSFFPLINFPKLSCFFKLFFLNLIKPNIFKKLFWFFIKK